MKFEIANTMKTALDAYSLREKTIANNLANADTPNYKREFVRFEEYLKDDSEYKLEGYKTNIRHFDIPRKKEKKIEIEKDEGVSTRLDKNNVNVDVEQAQMSQNYINYTTISQDLSSYYKSLITGITGGRK